MADITGNDNTSYNRAVYHGLKSMIIYVDAEAYFNPYCVKNINIFLLDSTA